MKYSTKWFIGLIISIIAIVGSCISFDVVGFTFTGFAIVMLGIAFSVICLACYLCL